MRDKIIDYLDGKLKEEEKIAFEKELAINEDLSQQLYIQKDVDTAIDNKLDYERLKKRVEDTHKKYYHSKETGRARTIGYYTLRVAAFLIVLVGITTLINFVSNSTFNLYRKNYTAWVPATITRDGNDALEIKEWVMLYVNKDYPAVVEGYGALNLNEDAEVNLMYACALMELDNYKEALQVLRETPLREGDLMEPELNWYVGLCLLKLEQKDNAVTVFERLIETSILYRLEAEEIVKKLKS